MRRIRAKVCGITNVADAQKVVAAGADAIGMILHAESPRTIDIELAKQIRQSIPPFVSVIGVVVNAEPELASRLYTELRLDLLQLHGEETAEYAGELDLPYIRAIRAKSAQQVAAQMTQHASASAFLLDPYVAGTHGGTGTTLDLKLWPSASEKPLILAGGLSPENLSSRLQQVHPFAVDLNSGVEKSPGNKSAKLIEAAMQVVHQHSGA